MNCSKNIILLICMVAVVSSTACGKKSSEKKAAHTGKDLPEFSLKDPRGKAFTKKDIIANGAVFVVTAPILSNQKEQEDWAKYLKATMHTGKGRLIFLQDMSPSSFKGEALSEMKKKSVPGKDPLLLIDPKGETRRKLGVEKEDTIILVYDKKGKCIHEERGKPSQKSAARVWKSLE
jgi:hypothetical protein